MIYVSGDKIYLKTFTKGEYHNFYMSYIPDPIMDPNPYNYDEKQIDKNYILMTENMERYLRIGIFLSDNTSIGELSIKRINYENSQCELGIILANDHYKGFGYGTQAIRLGIDYVTNTLKLEKIFADTMGSNYKMQHILEKLGFKFLNRDLKYYDMHNRWEDKLNYMLDLLNPVMFK